MGNVFKLIVALLIASGSAHAQTITAPESSVCLDNNGGDPGTGCDTGNLQPGNTYLLQSSRFQDFQGNPYDVAVEVLLKTTPDPRIITAFGQVDTGGFVQYNISFVNPVSMPMTVSPSSLTLFQPEDTVFSAFFEDIDSNDNSGGTFSEFVGVDTRDIDSPQFVLSGDTKLTTGVFDTDLDGDVERALTQSDGGGFNPGPDGLSDADLLAYSFAYADKINDSWREVPNITNRTNAIDGIPSAAGIPYTASFSLGSGSVDFDFIYGVANEGTSGGNTRQFALNVVAEERQNFPEPVPEIDGPVLVQVGFALGGLYVLMLGRRRREDDVEMSQAAA